MFPHFFFFFTHFGLLKAFRQHSLAFLLVGESRIFPPFCYTAATNGKLAPFLRNLGLLFQAQYSFFPPIVLSSSVPLLFPFL